MRSILVTGAASGIGEAVAKQLAGAGDRVVLFDTDADGLARVGAEIGAPATRVTPRS